MKPIRAAALPALGINRHLTLAVVHGPQRFQGVGIPDLWTLQGILKFWLTIQHGDSPTITGNQLRASMELHTMEIGLPGNLTQNDYKVFGHLATTSWIKQLWEFCDDSNIQLVATTPKLTMAKEKYSFLMAKFAQFSYRKEQLYHLNLCRLYCHATRLSDISTGDGQRIHPNSWEGDPIASSGREYSWPTHGRPSKKVWDLWRLAIRRCFLTIQMNQQILRQAMGPWTTSIPPNWQWFYSPSMDRVYKSSNETERYQMYSVIPNRRILRSPKYHQTDQSDTLPMVPSYGATEVNRHQTQCQLPPHWKHSSNPMTNGPSANSTV
jgi:hypothetical protein